MPNYAIESQYVGNEKAAIDLLENRAVIMGADGIKYAVAAGPMDGLVEYSCVAGEPTRIGIDSVKNAEAGAAIVRGAEVQVGTDGKLITLASGDSVGRAYTAASADGAIFAVKIK